MSLQEKLRCVDEFYSRRHMPAIQRRDFPLSLESAVGIVTPSLGDLMHEARPAAAALPDEDVLARWDRDNDGERWCGLS